MKHWIGYVVALIIAACTWALKSFAATHSLLVDMIYPYVSRMAMAFMTARTEKYHSSLWQTLLLIFVILIIVALVLYIWRRKNPIRWIGWTLTFVSVLSLVSTGIYGLSRYAGPLSSDIRLETYEYSPVDMQNALVYYQNHANELAADLPRDENGDLIASFDTLAQIAGNGFDTLAYEEFYSVFAGNTAPVKKLSWGFIYNIVGSTGEVFPLTGEAAVNANTPVQGLPFAMCRTMAKRISISNNPDSAMAAYLACINNDDPLFQYSGYFMAYRYCCEALESMPGGISTFRSQECAELKHDVDAYNKSFAKRADDASGTVYSEAGTAQTLHAADLLVSWHLQEVVVPLNTEDKITFDPYDETQVDLSGLPNA